MVRYALILALLFVSSANADLNLKIQEEYYSSSTKNLAPLQMALTNRHVLLWGGFRNEMIYDYYSDNATSLIKDLKVGQISMYMPSSTSDIKDTARNAYNKLMSYYHAGSDKPLVILAHSKGGAEAVLAMIMYPQLISSGVVDRVISIQGAIGGSPLSNIYLDYVKPFMPLATGLIFELLDNGAASLTREEAHAIFNTSIVKLSDSNKTLLNKRIFYVRAAQTGAKLFRMLKVSSKLMYFYGDNDGMILTRDMYRPELGTDLGILDADHNDLVSGKNRSNQTPEYRHAFTRALFRQVYQ